MRKNIGEPLVGLIFHGIGTPGRKLESGEAPYWVSIKQFEKILDQVQTSPNAKQVRISFDDATASDYEIALPRLLDRGLTANIFVPTGRIGQVGSLDTNQICTLQEMGMTIGSHGIAHVNWSRLSSTALAEELSVSRETLMSILAAPVTTAGIPFGAYNARVLRAMRQAGYDVAFSSDQGWMSSTAFLRPRTSVRAEMSDTDVEAILVGWLPFRQRIRRSVSMMRRRWL